MVGKLLIALLYFYFAFLLIQLALFNVILLGLLIILFIKLQNGIAAWLIKNEMKYQNKDFKAFLESQNQLKGYKDSQVNLTGGEQGMWLEFHLNDDAGASSGNNNEEGEVLGKQNSKKNYILPQ